MKTIPRCLLLASLALSLRGATPAQNETVVDRVGDTGFVALRAESFRALTPPPAGTRLLAHAGVDRD